MGQEREGLITPPGWGWGAVVFIMFILEGQAPQPAWAPLLSGGSCRVQMGGRFVGIYGTGGLNGPEKLPPHSLILQWLEAQRWVLLN